MSTGGHFRPILQTLIGARIRYLGEMTRRKREIVGLRNERDFQRAGWIVIAITAGT
jgi:hypothetical protein